MKFGIGEFYKNPLKLHQFSFERSVMRPATSIVISERISAATRMSGQTSLSNRSVGLRARHNCYAMRTPTVPSCSNSILF
jgi:hypothetical protein